MEQISYGFLVSAWLSVNSNSHLCPVSIGVKLKSYTGVTTSYNYWVANIIVFELSQFISYCNGFYQVLPC